MFQVRSAVEDQQHLECPARSGRPAANAVAVPVLLRNPEKLMNETLLAVFDPWRFHWRFTGDVGYGKITEGGGIHGGFRMERCGNGKTEQSSLFSLIFCCSCSS